MINLTKEKTVAVIGASNDSQKYGYKIVEKLSEKKIKVYPINLHEDKIIGLKAYKTLTDLPAQPDIINFVVSPEITIKVLAEIKKLNWDNVWFQPGSFDDRVINKAKELNLNYLDNACIMVAASKL